jgi:hypothetical protein
VVRIAAKSREAVSSSVDFLSLHTLVQQLAKESKSELFKLQMLKDSQVIIRRMSMTRHVPVHVVVAVGGTVLMTVTV